MREWMSIMKGILGGVITFIIITLVLKEFETELDGTGGTLLQTLIPLIVVLLILFHSFRGLEGGIGGRFGR